MLRYDNRICSRQRQQFSYLYIFSDFAPQYHPQAGELGRAICLCERVYACVPLMDERLGSMVTAPTATSSSWLIGLLFAPQLSDPIHRKCPT